LPAFRPCRVTGHETMARSQEATNATPPTKEPPSMATTSQQTHGDRSGPPLACASRPSRVENAAWISSSWRTQASSSHRDGIDTRRVAMAQLVISPSITFPSAWDGQSQRTPGTVAGDQPAGQGNPQEKVVRGAQPPDLLARPAGDVAEQDRLR